MKLITKEIEAKLIANGKRAMENEGQGNGDIPPVLKLFNPCMPHTWLITDCDPGEPDRLFGLCDLGHGSPELGYVSLAELQSIRLPFGLSIERDIYFSADKTLDEYAEDARAKGRITA